jgi:cytochrome c553
VNEQLWAALVEPDGRSWVQSLDVLGADPMVANDLPPQGPVAAQLTMDAEVHHLAHDALSDDNPDTRADLYGQIVTACASCHRVSRGEPPL